MAADLAFDALADPVRREILAVLAEHEECSAGELSSHIRRVGRTAVSSHLRVLRTAGLVTERRTGRFRYYSVQSDGPAQDVIRLLQELFQGSLDEARAAVGATRPAAAPTGG
ncbi:MAG TPA: metalloregulator ArsR/SmtB family transcription factor [Pseudonocardia sp.]|nr:metalloregulator ArsR/SmtB family transcription factor [Pseudonocardia sp.]